MIRAICLTAVSALLLGLGLSVPAQADNEHPGKLMLVLDSSGSMKEKTGGTTKIAAAKEALGAVIDKLPTEQQVGLRVYGAKVFSAKDKGACTDSQRVVDLGSDNRDELKDAVAKYKPYGETPIGYALQQAGKDLGDDGQRTIVLVSDGQPTCDPDPCVVAKDLSKDGINLKIDVVGLDVSGKARDTLKCIADKGNGTYYDADDAKSLTDSLTITAVRASRPFDFVGEPVKGTASPEGAPTLSTGVYLDSFPLTDGVWYRIERTAPRSTIHVGITHKSTDTGNFGQWASVKIYDDANGSDCDNASSFPRGSNGFTAVSSWDKDPESGCNTADVMYVHVERIHDADDHLVGTPVELAVYEEPPLVDPTGRDLASAPEPPTWTTIEPADPASDIVPGTSNANAPVVSDGSYAFDINPGETQVVAIPLDWGQNLQAQFDGRITSEHHRGTFDEPTVQILGPVRQESDGNLYGVGNEPDDWTRYPGRLLDDITSFRTGTQSLTLGYLNRADVNDTVSGSSLPGLRYVQVSYPAKSETPIEYTLTLRTNGTAGEGAPKYAKVKGLIAPKADSALVTGTRTTSDAKPAPDDSRTDKKNDGGGLPMLPIGLGVLGVLLIGGAYTLLRKARSSA